MGNVDLRSLTPEARAELKRVAIRYYRSGKNKSSISRELGLRRGTITSWILAYEKTGKVSSPEGKRGRPSGQGRTLTEAQEDRTPDQLKLAFALWSADAVRPLIYPYYRINMPIRTVRSYLSRWGFTPQRPVKKAYEQQPKAVQKWLDESYPAIKQQAVEEEAEIHWGDEAGMSSQEHYPRDYAPKGKTPTLTLAYSQRERVNMISSITNQGKMRFMIYQDPFNHSVLIRFLKQLIKNAGKKIYLILDNLRVHHSKPVKEWFQKYEEQIQLFFLPSYSPELNPDEYLNCDLKAKIRADKPTRKKGDMKTKMLKHLKSIQTQPDRVKSYFSHRKIA